MAISLKITVRFTDVNKSGANNNDAYKVYRAVNEDPCPGGIPNLSANGYTVFHVTNPPAFSDNEGVGIIEHEDTSVALSTNYFYRCSLLRGSEEIMIESASGPIFVNSAFDLAYPNNIPDNNSGLPNSVNVEPLLHMDAAYQSFQDPDGTKYPSSNQIINRAKGYSNFTPVSTSTLDGGDIWQLHTSSIGGHKAFRASDGIINIHKNSSSFYFSAGNWGESQNYYGHETGTGSTPDIFHDDWASQDWATQAGRGTQTYSSITGSPRRYVLDLGLHYFLAYIPLHEHPTLTEDSSGNSGFFTNKSQFGLFGGGSAQPGQDALVRWSNKSRFTSDPAKDTMFYDYMSSTGGWAQLIGNDDPRQYKFPTFATGAWSGRDYCLGVTGGTVRQYNNTTTLGISDTPNKINILSGYLDYNTGRQTTWLNGLVVSTSLGMIRGGDSQGRSIYTGNYLKWNYGKTYPLSDPTTGNFPGSEPLCPNLPIIMLNNAVSGFGNINFTELLFFPEKLTKLDEAKVISYLQSKFGSDLAPQSSYLPQ